jgi:hypothetical protein
MQKQLPRGIRNNNPLNIRISGTPWQGKVTNNTDGTFEQFTSLEYGVRAALVNIRTYIKRDRLCNITQIISRWAPSSDGNNVKAYIEVVCSRANLTSTEVLKYNDKNKLCRLVWAMAYVECGCEISFGRVENAWAII